VIRKFGELVLFGLLAMVLVVVPVASSMADTSAASFHWARKRPQFTLKVGDNVSGDWNTYLRKALKNWNENDTVTLDKVGGGTNPQECRPTKGRVEVCNWQYGTQTGWLGLTRLYFNDRGDHIEEVTVQLNDSFLYASNSKYNSNAARRHTICHELGHSMGLEGHVENRSCMNDNEDAIFNNVTPIRKDFRELEQIYSHKDGETTVSSASVTGEDVVAPASLPPLPSEEAAGETVTVQKLDDGRTVVTFITWAQEQA
jgi:hypothetical protein